MYSSPAVVVYTYRVYKHGFRKENTPAKQKNKIKKKNTIKVKKEGPERRTIII